MHNVTISAGARKMVLVGPSFNLGATAPSPLFPWARFYSEGGRLSFPHWRRDWLQFRVSDTCVRVIMFIVSGDNKQPLASSHL